jgi:GT2 family glycosyltransferase
MDGGIVLGINHDDTVSAPFAIAVQRVSSYGVQAIWCRGYAGRLDRGRNEVMRAFLDDYEEEWLLMLDTDMVFRPADVASLMQKADSDTNPISGGLYVREDQQPVAMRYIKGKARPWDGKGRGLVEMDFLGFGFTVINRKVLLAMEDRVFCDNARTNEWGDALADDSSFCWRAKELGFSVKLNTDVKLGHTKSLIFFPEGYE